MQVIKKIVPYTLLFLLLSGKTITLSAQTPAAEYQLKAIFLYNFTQFIDWPANSFSSADAPLVIGILGKDPFGAYLQETVNGEKANTHPLTIRHYNSVEEATACHVLFINLPDAKKREKAVNDLRGKNILTVSDAEDFTKQGGMIKFFTKDNKIKFQVNLEASRSVALVISSKLLRLAEIFKP